MIGYRCGCGEVLDLPAALHHAQIVRAGLHPDPARACTRHWGDCPMQDPVQRELAGGWETTERCSPVYRLDAAATLRTVTPAGLVEGSGPFWVLGPAERPRRGRAPRIPVQRKERRRGDAQVAPGPAR